MNTNTREPLEAMAAELVGHGLPADYAQRAASELADHHRDLVEELQATGWTDEHAFQEASRRLGEPRALVKRTVCEYQRRYWCGRWPLITFLLGPIPGLLVLWFATLLAIAGVGWLLGLLIEPSATARIEFVAQYVVAYSLKAWLTLLSPVLVIGMFCWLSARAALGRAWPCVAAVVMAIFIGFVQCGFQFKTATNSTGSFMIGYNMWFLPEYFNSNLIGFFRRDLWQLCQLILPLAVAGLGTLYFQRRAAAVRWQSLAS